MRRLLRRLLGIPEPTISRQQAVQIARRECERKGWPWEEPILVEETLRTFRVYTNQLECDGGVHIRVDAVSAEVVYAGRSPR